MKRSQIDHQIQIKTKFPIEFATPERIKMCGLHTKQLSDDPKYISLSDLYDLLKQNERTNEKKNTLKVFVTQLLIFCTIP